MRVVLSYVVIDDDIDNKKRAIDTVIIDMIEKIMTLWALTIFCFSKIKKGLIKDRQIQSVNKK